MRFPLYREPRDGIHFIAPYRPMAGRLRGEAQDEASAMVYRFKQTGARKKIFRAMVEGLLEFFGCQTAVGVPASGTGENAVQRVCNREVRFVPVSARPNRHNFRGNTFTKEKEAARVRLERADSAVFDRVLLVDDVASTGATLRVYRELLLESGAAKEVVLFAFGKTQCRFEKIGALVVQVPDEKEEVTAGVGLREPELDWYPSKSALAAALGVSHRPIDTAIARGELRKTPQGYDARALYTMLKARAGERAMRQGLIVPGADGGVAGNGKNDASGAGADTPAGGRENETLHQARLRRERAEADKQEALARKQWLQVRQMERELVVLSSVESAWTEMRQFILTRLEGLVYGLSPTCREECDAAVRQMCGEFQQFAETLRMEQPG